MEPKLHSFVKFTYAYLYNPDIQIPEWHKNILCFEANNS